MQNLDRRILFYGREERERMKAIILLGALLVAFEVWYEVNKDRWM